MEEKVEFTKEALIEQLSKCVNLQRMLEICNEIADLVIDKNTDYGDAWQRYSIFTPLIRINDKILRVETLSKGQTALVAGEKIEDTLKDIVGYAILALLWLDHQRKFVLTEKLHEACADATGLHRQLSIDDINKVIDDWSNIIKDAK